MPMYRYRAITSSGERISGEMDATNTESVISRLADLGHLPVWAGPASSSAPLWHWLTTPIGQKIGQSDLPVLIQEFARLINAEVTVEQALDIMIEVSDRRAVRRALEDIQRRIREGETVADAFKAQGGAIEDLHVSMIRAGEAGGALGKVLNQLSDYIRRSRDLRAALVSASIYPAILLLVSVGALVMILTLVVPKFQQMFTAAGAALPMPTQIVVDVSTYLQAQWSTMLAALLGAIVLLRLARASHTGRLMVHGWLLALPVAGPLLRRIETARFCRTVATLAANGVPLPVALTVARDVLKNEVMRTAVDAIANGLKEGRAFADSLQATGRFPTLASRMVRVGEETGQLDRMLFDVAAVYDEEVQTTLKRLLSFLEPFIILTLGLMIGGIIASILLAIVSINQLAI